MVIVADTTGPATTWPETLVVLAEAASSRLLPQPAAAAAALTKRKPRVT
jgi:hypothetical protein